MYNKYGKDLVNIRLIFRKDWVGGMRPPSLCRHALKRHPKVLQIWRWHIQT